MVDFWIKYKDILSVLFSGIGVTIILGAAKMFGFFGKKKNVIEHSVPSSIVIHNANSISTESSLTTQNVAEISTLRKTLENYKNETHILFIDDETNFQVVKIFKKSGWIHTKLIKDAPTLEDIDIVKADILFIDIQGVGVSLGFREEGLGLTMAIKRKYPEKKVIIYSAESQGERFHEALKVADSFLAKTADSYEFLKIVEDFTINKD